MHYTGANTAYVEECVTSKHITCFTCLSGKRMAASSKEAYSSLLKVLAEQLGSASSLQARCQRSIAPKEYDLRFCFASNSN